MLFAAGGDEREEAGEKGEIEQEIDKEIEIEESKDKRDEDKEEEKGPIVKPNHTASTSNATQLALFYQYPT